MGALVVEAKTEKGVQVCSESGVPPERPASVSCTVGVNNGHFESL